MIVSHDLTILAMIANASIVTAAAGYALFWLMYWT